MYHPLNEQLRACCQHDDERAVPAGIKKMDARSVRYSVIVCSVDHVKFAKLEAGIKRAFRSPVQLIRISDARSLAAGYNHGIQQADGDVCVFCHDDIELLDSNLERLLDEDLAGSDIVGVAGTTKLVGGSWVQAGQPHIHGQVGHLQADGGYTLCVYGMGRDPHVIHKIQALDGLFLAVKRSVLDRLSFDAGLFDGFHLYDLDFTFNAYLKGHKLIVDQRIHLAHQSSGNYDRVWEHYAGRFKRKYAQHLVPEAAQDRIQAKSVSVGSQQDLLQLMRQTLRGRRVSLLSSGRRRDGFIRLAPSDLAARNVLPLETGSVGYLHVADATPLARRKAHWMNEIFRVCDNSAMVEFNIAWPRNAASDRPGFWDHHDFHCFDINNPGYARFGRKMGFKGALALQQLEITHQDKRRRLIAVFQVIKNQPNAHLLATQRPVGPREGINAQSPDRVEGADWQAAYQSGRNFGIQGNAPKAIAAFEAAVRLNPHAPQVYHDLGVILHQTGRYGRALECFERAIALHSGMAQAWYHGGSTLCALQRPDEAVRWFQTALQLQPDFADAHYNLAHVCKTLGLFDQALKHCREALAINPAHAEAHNNMGTILLKNGRPERALACFQRAMILNPRYHQAVYNSAIALQRLDRLKEAIDHARQALQIQPGYGDALALLVPLLQQACHWTMLDDIERQLESMTRQQLQNGQRPAESPFLSFTRTPVAERNFQVAAAWSRWLDSKQPGRGTRGYAFNDRRAGRSRITIGYLSEQFRNAATAHLTAGLFQRHSRDKFKIIAYSWGGDDGSAYRQKIVRDVDQFVDIRSCSDTQAARRIYDDQVDILVDLMGWMHGQRMGILLQRPAPVQVNYLGYPGTTGAPFIDYILADAIVIPAEHFRFFSEKVVWLPNCYQVTDPDPQCFDGPLTRSAMGLPQNGILFCAFNTDYKIEAEVFDCWMQILRAVPNSVLWLIVRDPLTKRNLRSQAQLRGMDAQRLIFADPLPKARHLARIKLADLALDTFTVNGHTTASDTLWAGVPLITLQGTHFASRVAASILNAAGLNELVARNTAAYKRLAVELALDPGRLSALKSKLGRQKSAMPLFDTDRFVGYLERAYSQMWRCYTTGRPAQHFAVGEEYAV